MDKYRVKTDKKTVYFEKYKYAIMGARFLIKYKNPKCVTVTIVTTGKNIMEYKQKEQ